MAGGDLGFAAYRFVAHEPDVEGTRWRTDLSGISRRLVRSVDCGPAFCHRQPPPTLGDAGGGLAAVCGGRAPCGRQAAPGGALDRPGSPGFGVRLAPQLTHPVAGAGGDLVTAIWAAVGRALPEGA